jgi:hypothetical protein
MKIQPEFNIAAILSKISVADVASNQLSAAQRATSPFESYFEAALQEIDDPQLAATIATLNESGMIVPDSSGAFSAPDASSVLHMAATPEVMPLSFRTLQLLNGRSVITTAVAFSDTAIRSSAMSESLLADDAAFRQQRALIADTDIVPKELEVAAASVSPAILASVRASRPVTLQTVTEASVMPQGQTTVPSVQMPTQEAAQSQLAAPTQSVPSQTAVPAQLAASAEPFERPPSAEAWLSASGRASRPVTLQTDTAASVMPRGQTTVPSVQAPTQLAASAEPFERRSSTEAWLSSSSRANAEAEAPALVSTSAPRTSASGMSIIGASQNVSDSSARSRPGTREFAAQRFSRGDWSKLAGTAVLADAALAKSDQPALLATEIPGRASLHAALISESAVQPTSTNQVSVSVPGQPTAQPSADSQRTAERWMHVDDLGKQFGSVIQGALLNRTVAGQTSLRIMLYPENMGGIEAEIIDNNQSVTVNLIAQSDEVVRLLKDQSQALRDLLAQSGSFELNILKERSGSDAHQARDQSGSANDRSQPHLESLPKPGNGVAPGSLGPKESGELDTYV